MHASRRLIGSVCEGLNRIFLFCNAAARSFDAAPSARFRTHAEILDKDFTRAGRALKQRMGSEFQRHSGGRNHIAFLPDLVRAGDVRRFDLAVADDAHLRDRLRQRDNRRRLDGGELHGSVVLV
jgi:hypothetical protein